MDFKFTVEGSGIAALKAIVEAYESLKRISGFLWIVRTNGQLIIRGAHMSQFTLKDDSPGDAYMVQPLDTKGNPVTGASYSWSVSDPTILNLTVSTDFSEATISAVGPLSTAQLNVVITSADGTVKITASATIQVIAGELATATIVPVPAPAPPAGGGGSTPSQP